MSSSQGKHSSSSASMPSKGKANTNSGAVSSSTRSSILNSTSLNVRKIFVGGLHYGTVDSGLKRYFSAFGTVESAQVMYNRDTAKSRGFGFVVFSDEEAVDRVLDLGTYHIIDDKDVEIKRSVPKTGASAKPTAPAVAHTTATAPVASTIAPTTAPVSVCTAAQAPTTPPAAAVPATADSSKPPTAQPSAWKTAKGANPVAATAVATATATTVSSVPAKKGGSWVSAVVGASAPAANSLPAATETAPAAAPTPSSTTTQQQQQQQPAHTQHEPHTAEVPHAAPASTGGLREHATVSALGLGLDLLASPQTQKTANSSIADLLRNSLSLEHTRDDVPLPPYRDEHLGNLPADLPLFGLPSGRPPHSASWDLTETGTAGSEAGLGFSGGESVVSTLTSEDADGEHVDGRRARGKSTSSLILGLSGGPGAPVTPTTSAAVSSHGSLNAAPFASLPPGLQPFPGQAGPGAPLYHPYAADPSTLLASAMAAAALSRMYSPWMLPGAQLPPNPHHYGMPAPQPAAFAPQPSQQVQQPHHQAPGAPPGLPPRDASMSHYSAYRM